MQTWPVMISGVVAGLFLAFGLVLPIYNKVRAAQAKKNETAYFAKQESIEADARRKKLDHQLNHGRMIYNWLAKELEQYKDLGYRVRKIEQNGESFSIFIQREVETFANPLPYAQIDFNFLRKDSGYLGHIFYGAYGPDILFPVLDHAPKYGLDRLVLNELHREASRLQAVHA